MGASALVLTVAGAFAKMHRSTASYLYYTTSSASPVYLHCKLLATFPAITQFTTGFGIHQAKIWDNLGFGHLLFATSTCGSTRKVYFHP